MLQYLSLVGRVTTQIRSGETLGGLPVATLSLEQKERLPAVRHPWIVVYRLACLSKLAHSVPERFSEGQEVVALGFRCEVVWRAHDGGPAEPANVLCVALEERRPEVEVYRQIEILEQACIADELEEVLRPARAGALS